VLAPESEAAYRDIDLHFHDLRHEAGSRWIAAGWPLHHVKEMLGHASLATTDIYLNATRLGLHDAMKRFGSRSCKFLAKKPKSGLRPSRKTRAAEAANSQVN
jgi:site-specific recombinase XerD